VVRDLLIFGNGPHYCLGANLAREEIASLLEVLLDIVPPGSSVCTEAIETVDMGITRRATNLPVRIGAPGERPNDRVPVGRVGGG
jgi:cytochrome P450